MAFQRKNMRRVVAVGKEAIDDRRGINLKIKKRQGGAGWEESRVQSQGASSTPSRIRSRCCLGLPGGIPTSSWRPAIAMSNSRSFQTPHIHCRYTCRLRTLYSTHQRLGSVAKRILIVTHLDPVEPRAGNERRLQRLIFQLERAGHSVRVVTTATTTGKETGLDLVAVPTAAVRHSRLARRWGLDRAQGIMDFTVRLDRLYLRARYPKAHALLRMLMSFCCDLGLVDEVRKQITAFQADTVIAEYIYMAPVIADLSRRHLRIIDTHDVFSSVKSKVYEQGVDDSLHIDSVTEAAALACADIILAIQEKEQAVLANLAPEANVILTPVDFELHRHPADRQADVPCAGMASQQSTQLLFVGSANPRNTQGLEEFLFHCWPLLVQSHPDLQLNIAGSVCDTVKRSGQSVILHGSLEEIPLQNLYQQCDIVINPIRAGTGLKIKTIEALSFSKRIVSTPSGIEGIPSPAMMDVSEACWISCNHWQDFAEAVTCLVDESLQSRLKREEWAARVVLDSFSPQAAYGSLLAALA